MALWGAPSAGSPDLELEEAADRVVNSHLSETQRERLSALESSDNVDKSMGPLRYLMVRPADVYGAPYVSVVDCCQPSATRPFASPVKPDYCLLPRSEH